MSAGLYEVARTAHEAGLCVVPPKEDGSKAPLGDSWKPYQSQRPSLDQINAWYGTGARSGIGYVCGEISGGLELLEFEDQATADAFMSLAHEVGLADVVDRISEGYAERTPGGGYHFLYRCAEISGNTKLARRPKRPDEMRDADDRIAVLIETRGRGGYVVAAPSNGRVHPSGGAYRQLRGGVASIATLTPTERADLFALAKTFDQMPVAEPPRTPREAPSAVGTRPGDEFAARTRWAEILEPHGWTWVYRRGDTDYWRRPGKAHGISATTNHAESDVLYVFSSSTPFAPEQGIAKFTAYTILSHDGDFQAAAKALTAQGYGRRAAPAGGGGDTGSRRPKLTGELRVTVGDSTNLVYVVTAYVLKPALTATVSAVRIEEGQETYLLTDRIVLDRHPARVKFADAAGTDPNDLDSVRRRVMEHLAAEPETAESPAPPALGADLEATALALLDDPALMDRLGEAIRRGGYAGDLALPKVVYLVACTRGLGRPTNLQIHGPSAAGKTYLVNAATALLPATTFYEIAGSSPRALIYSEESLARRFLIVGEADGMHHEGIGASLMRGLIWGNKLVYETVESTAAGLKPVTITKDGPTGLITTGTKGLEPELATRMLTLTIPDDPETTRQILTATAARVNGQAPAPVDLTAWHAAQTWLDQHGCWAVTIPFGKHLAARYPVHLVRARRDFKQLLELISASAVLHQRQRERDEQGRIVADARDYQIVYDLAGPLFGVINAGGVTPAVRRVVEAVTALVPDRDAEPATALRVAERLGLDKSVVSRHVRAAITAGHLVNEESRRNQPLKLRAGDPLSDAKPALPAPDELFTMGESPATAATVQPIPGNPHSDAKISGCMSGCTDEAVAPGGARDRATVAPQTAHATATATADFGSSATKPGERLHGCTVARGVPDPCASDHVCLDCGMPIAAGSYCTAHGGDGDDAHEPIPEEPAWFDGLPDPVEPEEVEEAEHAEAVDAFEEAWI